MGWKPLLQYTFENHAAVDETGNGNFGLVELPARDRWVDVPTKGISTAALYDNPRSKIVVPNRGSFENWPGFRIRIIFRPNQFNRRINLVEGDGSFALFVEKDGRLMGTINDGHDFYGISSSPNTIIPHNWYLAEFSYDPSSTLILRLNQSLMSVMVTHGDAVLPVGPNGIRIGYWPGGDDRYTFVGLIGPVSIDILDPTQTLVDILGKLVCPEGKIAHGRLERLFPIIETEFTSSEKILAEELGKNLVDSVKQIIASLIGTSAHPIQTILKLQELSNQATELLIRDEEKGTDLFSNPDLKPILEGVYHLILSGPQNVRDILLAQVLKLLSIRPLSNERLAEILKKHPEICTSNPTASGFDPIGKDDPIGSLIGIICELCQKETNGGKGGQPDRCNDEPHIHQSQQGKEGCNVHVHIYCGNGDEKN